MPNASRLSKLLSDAAEAEELARSVTHESNRRWLLARAAGLRRQAEGVPPAAVVADPPPPAKPA